ncbi:MAG TPA: hypothetical protein VH020_00140 [Stellaceae bacterium]|nr:hypothetical protein [Stellaceae bacterium]
MQLPMPTPIPTVTLTLDTNSGNLVPGAATVPAFHMDFLLDDARRLSEAPIGSTRDLEISLTSPNSPVFRFLFSPRAQFGIGYDPVSGTSRGYAGLTWDLFTDSSIYGRLGLATSFDPGIGGFEASRLDVAPLMFHGAVEFGYRLDQQNSVSFAIDEGLAPAMHGAGSESVDNFILRYGTKF